MCRRHQAPRTSSLDRTILRTTIIQADLFTRGIPSLKATFLLTLLCWLPVAVADAEPELSNAIKWATASEVENFGYDVYRAESEDGPFQRVTPKPVAGGGTVDEPQYYRWLDTTIEADKVYFYYVESISLSGERERFTPVLKAKAKRVE